MIIIVLNITGGKLKYFWREIFF